MTDTSAIEAMTEIALRGLRQGDGSKVRQGAAFLEGALTTFVEELRTYGVALDERALREDLIGWRALNDITSQIGKFVRGAVATEQIEFIRDAERLADKLAKYGVESREYVTFQTAMQLLASLYWLTSSAQSSDVREFGRTQPKFRIGQITTFYLLPALRAARPEQYDAYGPLLRVCFKQYQQLLIHSIELRDFKTFKSFLAGL